VCHERHEWNTNAARALPARRLVMQGEYYMGRKAMSVFFFGGVWAWREVRFEEGAVRACLLGIDWHRMLYGHPVL